MIAYRDQLALEWQLTMLYGENSAALAEKRTFSDGAVDRIACCKALKNTLSGEWPRHILDHKTGQYVVDALKDEQAQGITIDTARCFFKTHQRDYIIIDAPGHIEFLKNMVTGASRAEAALLVIDAKEGIQENSKRHGHTAAMLGISQLVVLVNKMDLVDYDQQLFENIKTEFTAFLAKVNITPITFIPISAFYGDNIATRSGQAPWYDGPTVLEQLDAFGKKRDQAKLPFRMPVQDIYKFTAAGDDRRIVATLFPELQDLLPRHCQLAARSGDRHCGPGGPGRTDPGTGGTGADYHRLRTDLHHLHLSAG